MDATSLDVIGQQTKDVHLVPIYIVSVILMMGIHTYWFHQIIYVTYPFAAFVMNVGKKKLVIPQFFCC
jgi:hypothetical protein